MAWKDFMTSIALAAHPTHDDQRVAQVLNRALEGGPPNATHGNIPTLSQHNGVSKSTIHRWFQLFNRSPHRQRHFKISNNPYYMDKLQDILGLKSEATGSCRCPLLLPLGLDHGKGVTHDSIRHGATTLFAALAVATGNVLVRVQAPPSAPGSPLLPGKHY